MKGYDEDLAFIHDTGFGEFSRSAAPYLLSVFTDKGIKEGLVVDLGCGSGIWAEQLHRAGYGVLGIDLSASMLRIAKRRVPTAQFRCSSYLEIRIPSCVAVTALGEVLNYRFDGRNDRKELKRLFRRIHGALSPGGVLIFDMAEPGRGKGYGNRFWKGKDWVLFQEVEEVKNKLTRRITTFRKAGSSYHRHDEIHVLRLYRAVDISSDLRAVGFRVRVRRSYGNKKLLPHMAAFIAQRR